MSDFYYEIQQGTEAYNIIKDGLEMRRKWNSKETGSKVSEFLGIDEDFINKNLFLCHRQLILENIPESLKDQFKKPNSKGHYGARQALNKKWIKFCEENGLGDADFLGHFRIKFSLWVYAMTFYFFDNGYFIECKKENLQQERDFLIPTERVEFLRVHLAYEEKHKNEVA